jgi:hypothetical protein
VRTTLFRAVVVAALVGLVLPAHADVSVVAPARLSIDPFTGRTLSLDALRQAGIRGADAAELHLVSSLVAAGLPKQAFGLRVGVRRSGATPSVPCGTLLLSFRDVTGSDIEPAGDLDADGRPDVVEQHISQVKKHSYRWFGAARDARTGRVLWSKSYVFGDHQGAALLPMPMGPRHEPGVLLFRYGVVQDDTPLLEREDVGLDFEGLDGRGRARWHRHAGGSYSFDVSSLSTRWHHYPYDFFVDRFRAGADDVLVHSLDSESAAVRSSVTRIAGDTGAVAHPYPTVSSGAASGPTELVRRVLLGDGGLPTVDVVPDQDGDRWPDVLFMRKNGESLASVYRGSTGKPIWSTALLPLSQYTQVYDAGVLTQGETRIHDLAILTSAPAGLGVILPVPLVGDRLTGLVLLVQGGNGGLQWALPGSGVYPMNRYRGAPAIGVASSSTELGSDGSTHVGAEIDVVDGLGVPRAVNRYAVQHSSEACSIAIVLVLTSDDFTPDGSPEARIRFDAFGPVTREEHWITVDGASGRELDRSGAWTLGGSVDGSGADRADVALSRGHWVVDVVRGDAATRRLLHLEPPLLGKINFLVGATSQVMSRGRCQDLVVESSSEDRGVTYVLDGHGSPWWTLRYSNARPAGAVQVGRSARARC